MPLKLPCDHVKVSLFSIQPQGHPPLDSHSTLGSNSKPLQLQDASVLHLDNSGTSSFVSAKLLQSLYRAKYGPDRPLPTMDEKTQAQLCWQYPTANETQVTTHHVLHTAVYDVILRRQDWERPVQRVVTQLKARQEPPENPALPKRKSQRQSARLQQKKHAQKQRHQGEPKRSSKKPSKAPKKGKTPRDRSGHRSDDQRSQAGTVPASPQTGPEDENNLVNKESISTQQTNMVFQQETPTYVLEVAIPEFEAVQAAPGNDDTEKDPDAFWQWSKDEQQWYHQDDDGSILWFQELFSNDDEADPEPPLGQ
ncbi:hypothetical protein FDECE_15540 [Fusarium decemcellulare]|nr:hypothetical protein FDECE_15540 [Fusarium decemcellulare]